MTKAAEVVVVLVFVAMVGSYTSSCYGFVVDLVIINRRYVLVLEVNIFLLSYLTV